MRKLLKNYLLQNRKNIFIIFLFVSTIVGQGQVANYISNGGFETVVVGLNAPTAKKWSAIDSGSSNFYALLFTYNLPPYNVPLSGPTYQWPKTGNNFLGTKLFCPFCSNSRGYPKNYLKQPLNAGSTYCVKFYCNITNQSTHGIDGIGAYFGGNELDTITQCNLPLTYIFPQIQNSPGNIMTDTLNWIPITGTFVANGTEKYIVLGNFKSDTSSDTVLINPAHLPELFCDVLIDDVSCIDLNLPAFAGRDTSIIPGDSIFIGRESDIGIDEACMWYKLPTIITPSTPALDTVAGFWIKPVTSSTYIVRQQLWCSSVKWDTVVIHMNPVGIEKLKVFNEKLKLFPVPTKDELQLSIDNADLIVEFHSFSIYNKLGLLIREEEMKFENGSLKIKTEELPNGVYSLQLKSSSNETFSKRFVIFR